MNKALPYREAIRDYHPEYNRPPILHYPLRRVASHAVIYLWGRPDEDILRMAETLDTLDEVEVKELNSALDRFEESADDDLRAVSLTSPAPIDFYHQYVCPTVEGATVFEATLVHALGAAAQANVLAHRLASRWLPDPETQERMAEWAIVAHEIAHAAELYHHGIRTKRDRARRQARTGADKRHTPSRAIKDRFIDFYDRKEHRSGADAARRFYRSLTKEEQRILTPSLDEENSVRTLTAELRKRKKGGDST